ncbi:sigma-54-dependent Fis family transcriptional regulator [Companilactobacillus insicii]|uniref:sigma-54-dependent Fis family transcriptional regulator n=1 Tax=Companilactobacillus insicii TaxID=1732567 RepID=UPI001FE6D8D4|nr:sigma-54-dependent Fis family transcriptional regulator [Companilactobacillus insicii]
MNVLCISPYQSMHISVQQIYNTYADNYPNIHVYFEKLDRHEGIPALTDMLNERHYDMVISRGGTSALIKKITNIRVIDVGISQYDILSIIQASSRIDKIALVGFPEITEPFKRVADRFEKKVPIYSIKNDTDLNETLKNVKASGFNTVIGDTSVETMAEQYNLNTIFITSGEETIKDALLNGFSILEEISINQDQKQLFVHLLNEFNQFFAVFNADGTLYLKSNGLIVDDSLWERFESTINKNMNNFNYNNSYFKIDSKQYNDKKIYDLRREKIWNDSKNDDFSQLLMDNDKSIQISNLYHTIYDDRFFNKLETYAQDDTNIVILGEKGMSKKYLSILISKYSNYKSKVPILLNLESEKFFNAAMNDDKSILYESGQVCVLDKFNNLPYKIQRNFLNFIDETGFASRNKIIFIFEQKLSDGIDKNLEGLIANSHLVTLKPLRDVLGNSVSKLITIIINDYAKHNAKMVTGISDLALDYLLNQKWNNNLVEFTKVINSSLASTESAQIGVKDIQAAEKEYKDLNYLYSHDHKSYSTVTNYSSNEAKTLHEITREAVTNVLFKNSGNKTKTAKELEISRATLWRYLKEDN